MAKTKLAIEFSEEQETLLDIASNFCADKSPVAKVRERLELEGGFDPDIWKEIADLGWLGICVPEQYGGSALSLAEVVTIVEPMGRHLLATPFVSTTLVAQLLMKAGTEAQKSTWLPKICEGAIGAMGISEAHGDWDLGNLTCMGTRDGDAVKLSGTKTFVTDAAAADIVIASVSLDGSPALVFLEKSDLASGTMDKESIIDETRRSYRVNLDGISVSAANLLEMEQTGSALTHLHLAANLLTAAEMCGGLAACLNTIIEYLNTRKQFGKLIGSYQALKHPTVDILMGLEASRSHLYYAASVLDDPKEGEIAVRMAKVQVNEVFSYAGDRAIQFHGGFGFTFECDAQLYRRRSLWCENQFGNAAYHRKRLANLLLD